MKSTGYVAYVGTYTHENSIGIHIYDLDVENGKIQERKVVPINNPSDLVISSSGKYLYSIADEGVQSFRILEDGDLEPINKKWIGGMRGCYVDIDKNDTFLFVGGYHDGRITMMNLNSDGSIGEIADGIFHKGIGKSIAERNSRPHVTCVKVTPDQKYVCAVDCGLDQVKVYRIDYEMKKLRLSDIVRGEIDSSTRMLRFSRDGKFAYILNALTNSIEIYSYDPGDKSPNFEQIQRVSTESKHDDDMCTAVNLEISEDGEYLYASNAGVNSVTIFKLDQVTGKLSKVTNVKISGDYPKTLAIYPNGKYFMTLNHESNEICTFELFHDGEFALMHGKPVYVDKPNCVEIFKLRK
ncbi:MAG: lactonase family protein [Lachnospiraceae bacterium]